MLLYLFRSRIIAWPFVLPVLFFVGWAGFSAEAADETDGEPTRLEDRLRKESPSKLATEARKHGSATRGAILFHQPVLTCTKCHSVGEDVSPLGPDLAKWKKPATPEHIVESVLQPSKSVRKGYEALTVVTGDGKTITGLLKSENKQTLVLKDPSRNGKLISIPVKDIERRKNAGSIMPKGLANQLANRQQFLDLAKYLIEVAENGPQRAEQLRPPAALFALPPVPDYEKNIDHAGLIGSWNGKSFERGKAIYNRLCINCHGTKDRPGSLPTSLRFASGKFKNGSDPYSMYQTLTYGFGMMIPQAWMVPQQKYDVIHYVREAYLKPHNASQYVAVDNAYLNRLPKGTTRGPKPSKYAPWENMNYGPTLIGTYEAGRDGTNIAYKGIAVRLDAGPGGISRGKSWMVFDHDTLRVSAAWNGKRFIDYKGIMFNGRHNVHPRIAGELQWANPTSPGWANPETGSFEDPRLRGRDGKPYGPLPREWAHYTGLYHYGNQAVISYTVGKTPILEMPGVETVSGAAVFTRAFNIGPRERDMILQVAKRGKETRLTPVAETPNVVTFGPKEGAPRKAEPKKVRFNGATYLRIAKSNDFDMTSRDYTITARIRTRKSGTIFAKTAKAGKWPHDGKALFVRGGRLTFDIGWVGAVRSRRRVNDGKWHDVAMTWDAKSGVAKLFIDGKADASARLAPKAAVKNHEVRIGFAAPNFPRQSYFNGDIAEVRFYQRRLVRKEVTAQVVPKGRSKVARRFSAGNRASSHHKSPEGAKEAFRRPSGTHRSVDRPQPASELAGYSQVSLRDNNAPATRSAKSSTKLIGHWKPQGASTATIEDQSGNKHVATVIRGKASASADTGSLVAGLSAPINGAKWLTDDAGNLRLRIPAGDSPLKFTLAVSRVTTADQQRAVTAHLKTHRNTLDLTAFTKGGPPRWPQDVPTKPSVMKNGGPFEVDVLTRPAANPWFCRVRFTGLDFHPDGKRLAACSWDGDVWLLEGIDNPSAGLKWKRIASGLFQPLGLKFVDGKIHLTCRDQLVILHDLNGDGETDFYENFNNDHQVTEHFHEFAMGLQTDAQGNFYYAKSARHALPAIVPHHGTLLKVSKDGSKTEILANGFRAANGVCLNPDGTFYVTDQEGHWNPKNRINWVKQGGFYGNMLGYHDVKSSSDDAMEPPLCWITNKFDRSPAELLWVKDAKWGPLNGSLLNLSYGYGKVYVVLRQKVGELMQGGMCELPLPTIPTGLIRGRFRPQDGQLYACGMFAWAGSRQQPGGLYRIRYTGRPMHLPVRLEAKPGRMVIRFTDPLDADAAKNPANYKIKVWALKRTKNYGSKHYNEHPLKVAAVTVSKDGKTVKLQIPDLKPTWCMEIKYSLRSVSEGPVHGVIHNTIHALSVKK